MSQQDYNSNGDSKSRPRAKLKRDLNFNCIISYILINPIALRTDKGDVLEEKNYLHERTIDVRALLSSAFCDDPCVNRRPTEVEIAHVSKTIIVNSTFPQLP